MALKASAIWSLVSGSRRRPRRRATPARHRWTATTCCRAASTAATSTMPAAIPRKAPSSAPWSRACSRWSTCSPSSAIRRSAIGSRRWPTTRCPAPFDGDMWAHQYDQQPNQVLCSLRPRVDDQRTRVERLRPGAALRLLHRELPSGLAEARGQPVDGDARRRPRRRGVRAERGADDRGRRCAASRLPRTPTIPSATPSD